MLIGNNWLRLFFSVSCCFAASIACRLMAPPPSDIDANELGRGGGGGVGAMGGRWGVERSGGKKTVFLLLLFSSRKFSN